MNLFTIICIFLITIWFVDKIIFAHSHEWVTKTVHNIDRSTVERGMCNFYTLYTYDVTQKCSVCEKERRTAIERYARLGE